MKRSWGLASLFLTRTRFAQPEDTLLIAQLLSIKDIESTLKLGHTKTAELISSGEIETFTIGRRRMTTPALLSEFIERKIGERLTPLRVNRDA